MLSVLDDSNAPMYKWFVGGEMNTCHNAIDRHVDAGNGGRTALIWDSPVSGNKQTYVPLQYLKSGRVTALCASRVAGTRMHR